MRMIAILASSRWAWCR